MCEGAHDDHEPLQPHAEIDENRGDQEPRGRGADPFNQKEQWDDRVEDDHAPEGSCVVAQRPVNERRLLV